MPRTILRIRIELNAIVATVLVVLNVWSIRANFVSVAIDLLLIFPNTGDRRVLKKAVYQ